MNIQKHLITFTGDQQGMTLLEIMLAMLILGTVVTMVSVTLSGSLNVLNATRGQGEIYHRAQVALLRMSEDISSVVLVDDADFIGAEEQVDGQDAGSLQFTSTAHVVFNQEEDHPGIALISYKVQEDPDKEKGLVLIRSDELLATAAQKAVQGGDGEGFLLSDGLKSVSFVYIDDEGNELDTWSTRKDALSEQSERKLPVAVKCTLEYWVDRENDVSLPFSTSILLPAGLIYAQSSQTKTNP